MRSRMKAFSAGAICASPKRVMAPSSEFPGDRLAPVGQGAKFGEEIEDADRHRPAKREEATDLGAGVVGDEQ